MLKKTSAILILSIIGALPGAAEAARIKELVDVLGVRSNQLVGYGLVVGLAGTGDTRQSFTHKSIALQLKRARINVEADDLRVRNTAAVMVTAELPPFAGPGVKLDVTVSAIGNARSIASGTLIMTDLLGPSGKKPYASAQGSVLVGGYDVRSPMGMAAVKKNAATVGRIPRGAIVLERVNSQFVFGDQIILQLRQSDFTTASRISAAINKKLSGQAAVTQDPGSVKVTIPESRKADPVGLLAEIEAIDVTADQAAKVVVSERTGTIVVGGKVTLGAAAVAHGSLNVAVSTRMEYSQPGPFSQGRTRGAPVGSVGVREGGGSVVALPDTATVEDLVKALNSLGASPRDLISILQALKAAGSIHGELEVI